MQEMEKSNSETSQTQVSENEGDNQRREQPTTSIGENNSPVQNSHNMNDFKSLDFNSADDVRQAMKAVLSGHLPPQAFSEEANHALAYVRNKSEPVEVTKLANNRPGQGLRKTVQRQVQQNLYLKTKSTAQTYTGNGFRSLALKRRGRPIKAGPSRLVKRPRKSALYIGKLSNVVQFRRHRRCESESGSDTDSLVFY